MMFRLQQLVYTSVAVMAGGTDCLCLFNVERTLTGAQGSVETSCPADFEMTSVNDTAYLGGTLVLSRIAQSLNDTFCRECWMGAVAADEVSGPDSDERSILHDILGAFGKLPVSAERWSDGCTDSFSPLVARCADGAQHMAVPGILSWYEHRGVSIRPDRVYFFDDVAAHIKPFESWPYNARQVSCGSRDPRWNFEIGLCGATPEEIVPTLGVSLCEPSGALPDCPDGIWSFCNKGDLAGGGVACIGRDGAPVRNATDVECVPARNGGSNYTCPATLPLMCRPVYVGAAEVAV